MRRLFAISALLVLGCGGAKKDAETPPPQGQVPVWEDVDDAAYKFYRSVSKTLLRTNQPVRASQSIRRLFKLKPDDPEPRYLMGRAYVAMEQYESAIRMFEQAIDKDDDYAPAYSMMGVVLNATGQHKAAVEAHKKAIELDENNVSFHNNLGFGYYLHGKYKSAVAAYLDAINIDPGSRRVHNNLGFAYGRLGNVKAAKRHFDLAGAPAQTSNNLGFVYESRGELERAYEYYMVALEQNPGLVPAKKNLKRICAQLGRPVPEIGLQSKEEDGTDADASVPDS